MMKRMLVSLVLIFSSNVIETAQVIKAKEDDDVSFECQQDAKVNLEDSLVELSKDNHTDPVHFYRDGQDDLHNQKKEFRGRTTLLHEDLKKGNVILQLRSVRLSDSGRYSCLVKEQGHFLREFILEVEQKGQNNPTQDVSSAPSPVEAANEHNDPGGGRSHIPAIIVAACLIHGIGLLLLMMKYGKK